MTVAFAPNCWEEKGHVTVTFAPNCWEEGRLARRPSISPARWQES